MIAWKPGILRNFHGAIWQQLVGGFLENHVTWRASRRSIDRLLYLCTPLLDPDFWWLGIMTFVSTKTPSSNRLETLSQKAFRVFNTPLHFLSLVEASTNEVGINLQTCVCVFICFLSQGSGFSQSKEGILFFLTSTHMLIHLREAKYWLSLNWNGLSLSPFFRYKKRF